MRESPSSRPGLASHEWDIGNYVDLNLMQWLGLIVLYCLSVGLA